MTMPWWAAFLLAAGSSGVAWVLGGSYAFNRIAPFVYRKAANDAYEKMVTTLKAAGLDVEEVTDHE